MMWRPVWHYCSPSACSQLPWHFEPKSMHLVITKSNPVCTHDLISVLLVNVYIHYKYYLNGWTQVHAKQSHQMCWIITTPVNVLFQKVKVRMHVRGCSGLSPTTELFSLCQFSQVKDSLQNLMLTVCRASGVGWRVGEKGTGREQRRKTAEGEIGPVPYTH